jgi:hypothetical protein
MNADTETTSRADRLAVDGVTVAGLALLLMPLLTMMHEIGGHASACLALGQHVTAIGAFYVDCDAAHSFAARLVSAAGPAIDVLAAIVGYVAWRRARGDLARLILWYVWLCCAFAAAGYLAFSGVSGIGDLNPGDGGIGPLPAPIVFRVLFALVGGLVYWRLIVLGMRTLASMIGEGPATKGPRRTVAHLYYAVLCVAAVIASVPNPVGLFITLASATASSFGGNAGLISIGYATRDEGEARVFQIPRNWPLFIAGVLTSLAFAGVLGPTLSFASE